MKVLPLLERHMIDYDDAEEDNLKHKDEKSGFGSQYGSIRSFAVLGIAKTIRKLPIDDFKN